MRKVLVPRTREQAREFCDALKSHGLEPVCIPLIEIGPPDDWSACDKALDNLLEYDALVFTSANAVRFFIQRMAFADRNCDQLPAGFGLGSATKQTMQECGITIVPTLDSLNAAMLSEEICTLMSGGGFNGLEGMRFLFPCGDKARTEIPDELKVHGAIVDSVVVYKNQPASGETRDRVLELLNSGEISCIAFFSPSQVEALIALIPNFITTFRPSLKLAAIGNTTADAMQEAGMTADIVSSAPDVETYAQAILGKFRI